MIKKSVLCIIIYTYYHDCSPAYYSKDCINFYDRLELLFWIDAASDKIMQSNLDGSQPTAILDQQSHSCLSNSCESAGNASLY